MTDEQVGYSIQTNELNLGTWDKFNHYYQRRKKIKGYKIKQGVSVKLKHI